MKKILFFAALFLLFSCGSKQENSKDTAVVSSLIDYSDLPAFSPLTAAVDSVLLNWPTYQALDSRMGALSLVVSVPDLKILVAELLEKEQSILKEGYPKAFNLPAIKSRQRVLRTFLLKAQAQILLDQDPRGATEEVIVAFNALRDQMNLLLAPKIDLNNLEDEF